MGDEHRLRRRLGEAAIRESCAEGVANAEILVAEDQRVATRQNDVVEAVAADDPVSAGGVLRRINGRRRVAGHDDMEAGRRQGDRAVAAVAAEDQRVGVREADEVDDVDPATHGDDDGGRPRRQIREDRAIVRRVGIHGEVAGGVAEHDIVAAAGEADRFAVRVGFDQVFDDKALDAARADVEDNIVAGQRGE